MQELQGRMKGMQNAADAASKAAAFELLQASRVSSIHTSGRNAALGKIVTDANACTLKHCCPGLPACAWLYQEVGILPPSPC